METKGGCEENWETGVGGIGRKKQVITQEKKRRRDKRELEARSLWVSTIYMTQRCLNCLISFAWSSMRGARGSLPPKGSGLKAFVPQEGAMLIARWHGFEINYQLYL